MQHCQQMLLMLATSKLLIKAEFKHFEHLESGWWHSVAVTRCVRSTKLLYAGPG